MSAVNTASSFRAEVNAVYIVSLPTEAQTTHDVGSLVSVVLGVEAVESVSIIHKKAPNGVVYRSALVNIDKWSDNPVALFRHDEILASQKSEDVRGCAYSELMDASGNLYPLNIHFDNGKPMDHVRFMFAEKETNSKEPLALEKDAWTSIYIPFLPNDLSMINGDVRYDNEDTLSALFENELKVGKVSRIDFMSKGIPGSEDDVRCAYVHFDHWYDNRAAKNMRSVIEKRGNFVCNGFYDGFEFRRFMNQRFINFKVNYRPIPTVDESLNVHQLAAAKVALEQKVVQLEKMYTDACNNLAGMVESMMVREQKLKELQDEIADLKAKPMAFDVEA